MTYNYMTASEIRRRKNADSRATRGEYHPSGSALSRMEFFESKSVLSSCYTQLLESAIYSKNSNRESAEPERCMLTLTEVSVTALVGRKKGA